MSLEKKFFDSVTICFIQNLKMVTFVFPVKGKSIQERPAYPLLFQTEFQNVCGPWNLEFSVLFSVGVWGETKGDLYFSPYTSTYFNFLQKIQ